MRPKPLINYIYLRCKASNIILNYKRNCPYQQAARKIHSSVICLAQAKEIDWDEKYSEPEQEKILKHMNKKKPNELLLDSVITSFRAQLISEHQRKHGRFIKISDILAVEGIGVVTLSKICQKILTTNSNPGSNTFYPTLSEAELAKVKTILGFHIDLSGISWSLIDRNCRLIEWKTINLNWSQLITHKEFIEKIEEMKDGLPVADVYLLEKFPMRLKHQQVTRILNINTIETMIVSLLCALDKKIIRCKPTTVGRMFGLNMGAERVSGIFILKKMFQGESQHVCHISPYLQQIFESRPDQKQNSLCNSLLLALTFHSLTELKSEHDLDPFYQPLNGSVINGALELDSVTKIENSEHDQLNTNPPLVEEPEGDPIQRLSAIKEETSNLPRSNATSKDKLLESDPLSNNVTKFKKSLHEEIKTNKTSMEEKADDPFERLLANRKMMKGRKISFISLATRTDQSQSSINCEDKASKNYSNSDNVTKIENNWHDEKTSMDKANDDSERSDNLKSRKSGRPNRSKNIQYNSRSSNESHFDYAPKEKFACKQPRRVGFEKKRDYIVSE